MPIGREQKKDALELILLSVLAEQSLYGYAIIKQVAAQSEGAIRLSPGVLYPLLHELERGGLIASSWEEVRSDRKRPDEDSGGRKRKWYSLSAKGRKRLEQRVAGHRAHQAMIEGFLPGSACREGRVS